MIIGKAGESMDEPKQVYQESYRKFLEILDHWNGKKIVVHNKNKRWLSDGVISALREYSIEDIKTGIDNYATMYFDLEYMYCNYKWSLSKLLNDENGLREFLNDGHKWLIYCKFKDKRAGEIYHQNYAGSLTKGQIEELYITCLTQFRMMDYKEYIQTEHWKHFRKEVIEYFNGVCQMCGANDVPVEVHHKTYANRGRETFNDVTLLCRHCHEVMDR